MQTELATWPQKPYGLFRIGNKINPRPRNKSVCSQGRRGGVLQLKAL